MPATLARSALIGTSAVALALLWNPSVWRYLRHDFIDKDTIFILSVPERIGLVILTSLLFIALMWASLAKSRFLGRLENTSLRYLAPVIDLVLVFVMLVCAVAIAPQFLYTYYIVALDGLPLQWVTSWPKATHVLQWVRMSPLDSLNTMMRGLLFWSMIAAALLYWTGLFTRGMGTAPRRIASMAVIGVTSALIMVLR